jgi:long-subunit fatty acid transport protein
MMKNQAQAMMINRNIFIVILLFVWSVPFSKMGFAQTDDFQMRVGLRIQKDFKKKLNISVEYEHRFDNNLTTFDQALIEPSISYQITKPMTVGVEWRFMYDQDLLRRIAYKQRGAFFIRYKWLFGDFDFKFRTAIQFGFDDLSNSTPDSRNKIVNRNSLSVDYNWFGTKFTPFAGFEFFYHINHPNGSIINQQRFKIGTSYRISKASDVSVNYIFENEFNVAEPVNAHVIGLGYSFKF